MFFCWHLGRCHPCLRLDSLREFCVTEARVTSSGSDFGGQWVDKGGQHIVFPKLYNSLSPMWPPADKDALPTKSDIWSIKKEIMNLEVEFQRAVKAFKRAKEHMLHLKQVLEERRTWITPIRTVPAEVLTEILLFASETEDLALVKLTAVCRLWRQIMLTTPRAWSFIYLKKHENRDYYDRYLEVFFNRSRPLLLHLSLPDEIYDEDGMLVCMVPMIVWQNRGRIRCLTISGWHLSVLLSSGWDAYFLHLETLHLTTGHFNDIEPRLLTRERFPVLQSLHWPSLEDRIGSDFLTTFVEFVSLQHLSLEVDDEFRWLHLIWACATTLKGLEIRGHVSWIAAAIPTYNVVLPILQSLHLNYQLSKRHAGLPFRLVTPALTCIDVGMRSRQNIVPTLLAVDTLQVTCLRIRDFRIPDGYPALEVLQIDLRSSHPFMWNTEGMTMAYFPPSPHLEVIEIIMGETYRALHSGWIRETIDKKLKERGVVAQFLFPMEWEISMPAYAYKHVSTVGLHSSYSAID